MNTQLIRILFVTLVFLLFLANATGLLHLELTSPPHFSIESQWFTESPRSDGAFTLPRFLWSPEMLLFLITGTVLSLSLPRLSPIPASIVTMVMVIPPVYLNYSGYMQSAVLPMEYFLLTILILYVVNVLISYFEETHIRQQIISTFSHYAPPQIVHELCKHPKKISLKGQSRDMSVLFCDLVNFSAIAEIMDPVDLTSMLNEYFTRTTDILHRHEATIDKFIGDSVMAFWGAPLQQPKHATQAVRASFDLHAGMADMQDYFLKRGWPHVEMRIGMNSGLMNVGNMGTQHRITYTVIGDAVNIAARVEQLTRIYHVKTIVSEYTSNSADEFLYRLLDLVYIKGRNKPVRIYEPMCIKSEATDFQKFCVRTNDEAVVHYLEGNNHKALELFSELQTHLPNDLYTVYMLNKVSKLSSEENRIQHDNVTGSVSQGL